MKITSEQIKMALKTTFPAPGWRVFFEVGNDTGARTRRHADAVAMGIWPSNGHLVHGFEIKVARGDFLVEMKNPTKSQAVFQFCDRWSLVTPPGLVKVDEVPEPWGLMTFNGTSMRTVKQAPKLDPVPLTPGFVAAMLRRAGEADDALLQASYHKGVEETQAKFHKRMEDWKAREQRVRAQAETTAVEKLGAYHELFGDMSRYQIERMAPVLKAVQQISVSATVQRLRGLRDRFKEIDEAVAPLVAEMEDDVFGDLL